MKGIIFTEFLEMVEDKFGEDILEEMLERAQPPSGGAYTSLGTYDQQELLGLVTELSQLSGAAIPALIKTFGHYLVGRFQQTYPSFFAVSGGAFAFLKTIEEHIHVEVRKLYTDTELPTFSWQAISADKMSLTYRSRRPFAILAEGMIEATFEHFGERAEIEATDLSEDGFTVVRFELTRLGS